MIPERYKKLGFNKLNSPKKTPSAAKSHAVLIKEGGNYKLIRFGQQGVSGSPKKEGESESYRKRRESFKARHSDNIAKGKTSAAYWANKVKWEAGGTLNNLDSFLNEFDLNNYQIGGKIDISPSLRTFTVTDNNSKPKPYSKPKQKTDKEIADERRYLRYKANKNPLNNNGILNPANHTRENWSEAAQGLESKFRTKDEPNFFDDYLNPISMVGSLASSLGTAPLRAEQEDSVIPYITSVGSPLVIGSLAGAGTTSTKQFINNLTNPLAGTGELINSFGNKYISNISKSTLNPYRFKAEKEMGYRMLGKEGYEDAVATRVLRAKPLPNQITEGISLSRNTNRNPNTGRLQSALDRPYFADGFIDERYASDYMVAVNKAENGLVPIPTHKGIAPSTARNIPLENAILYKKDWLRGYKQINNYQAGGYLKNKTTYVNKDGTESRRGLWANVALKKKRQNQVGGSELGYKSYSPDVNNSYNVIDSGRITMQDVDFPVQAIDYNTGNNLGVMQPNKEYDFRNRTNKILEIPMKRNQVGGSNNLQSFLNDIGVNF